MRRSRLLVPVSARRGFPVALLLFCTVGVVAAGTPPDHGPDDGVLPGMVVVKFRPGVVPLDGAAKTGFDAFDGLAQAFQVYRLERAFPFLDAAAAKRPLGPRAAALRRVYYVRYEGTERPRRVAAALARDPHVEWAEPYFVYRLVEDARPAGVQEVAREGVAATPDDPLFSSMTHLQQLRLPEAWDVVQGEQGIEGAQRRAVIAIVDGGTEWRHPDLMANVWTNPGEIPGNGIDDDDNGFVDDVHGWNFANDTADPAGLASQPGNARHGTSTAGIAAAVTNNGLGVAGASWNATLMPINAACPNDDNLVCFGFSGMLYAASNGADVVNASWGGPERARQLEDIIRAVTEMGTLVVASAGNDNRNADLFPFFPAQYKGVLSVGATSKNADTKIGFSNFGRSVDVFAPGGGINTTFPNGQYGELSGTSFSAPLVAGIAALVKTRNPAFTPDQVRERIRVTSDNIDAANPATAGRLGRGRVNALRAATEDAGPAIRLDTVVVAEASGDGDGLIESGETARVTATFTNFLAGASGVTVTLVTDDAFIDFTNNTAAVGAMPSGAAVTVDFSFSVAAGTPNNRAVLFFAEVSAGAYTDADLIRLVVNETAFANHVIPTLRATVTNEGNIGFLEFAGDSPGVGFNTRGIQVLFEGGLLVATGPTTVSNSVRGVDADPGVQNEDFVLQEGTALEIISPAALTHEQGQVSLTDEAAPSPLGVLILQNSYVDTAPENEDFMIVSYTITNTTDAVLSNLYAGLYLDWDVNQVDPARDAGRFDEQRQFGYVQNLASGASVFAGAHLLTTDAPLAYRAVDNPSETYGDTPDGGFTRQEKWAFLSDGVQRKTLSTTDVAQLVGAGPYSIDPGASVLVAFALAAGRSEADLLAHVDNAQALWDDVINPTDTAIDDPIPAPPRFALEPVYPNPAVPPATLAFAVAEPSRVTLTVYDILGREVQTLAAGPRGAGRHAVAWDGTDRAGRRVAGGLYFVRLTAVGPTTTFAQARSVVVVR